MTAIGEILKNVKIGGIAPNIRGKIVLVKDFFINFAC